MIDSCRCANVFRSGPRTRKPTAAVEVVPVNTSTAGIHRTSILTACHVGSGVVALTVGHICVVQLVPRATLRYCNCEQNQPPLAIDLEARAV